MNRCERSGRCGGEDAKQEPRVQGTERTDREDAATSDCGVSEAGRSFLCLRLSDKSARTVFSSDRVWRRERGSASDSRTRRCDESDKWECELSWM